MDFLGNLHRQFARRAENQHLHGFQIGIGFLNRGNGERGGFAGAGLRLADDIAPAHQHGNGLGLDGRGLLEAHFFNGF